MARVILLNGPAGVGKDTIGHMLIQQWNKYKTNPHDTASHAEFKHSMFDIAITMAGITTDQWNRMYTREEKERNQPLLGGLSPRQFLIKISEEWIKPVFGPNHFGVLAEKQVRNGSPTVVFTDSGFIEEVWPLAAGNHDVKVFRLFREGYDFTGDSRQYLDPSLLYQIGVEYTDLVLKEGNPADTVHRIMMLENMRYRTAQVAMNNIWGGLHE